MDVWTDVLYVFWIQSKWFYQEHQNAAGVISTSLWYDCLEFKINFDNQEQLYKVIESTQKLFER